MDGAFGASIVTIIVATIASWMFGAVYYMSLAKPWMAAAGISEDEVKAGAGASPYIISVICEFIMAYMLAVLLLHTATDGVFTLGSALFAAFSIWLGFVVTTQIVNHRYSMKPWSLSIIDSGHWLGVLLIQAAVMSLMGL